MAGTESLGSFTNYYQPVQLSYQTGGPFAVFEAAYFPSNQILLTVAGVRGEVQCCSWISSSGSLEAASETNKLGITFHPFDPFGPGEPITNVAFQTLSPSTAAISLIDAGGWNNTVRWKLGLGWAMGESGPNSSARYHIREIGRMDTIGYSAVPLSHSCRPRGSFAGQSRWFSAGLFHFAPSYQVDFRRIMFKFS
jgi:hypothetical protein